MRTASLAIPILLVAACGDDEKRPDIDTTEVADTAADTDDTAADTADTTADTAVDSVMDTAADTADAADTVETQDQDVPEDVDEHGFHIRVPQIHTVPQENFDGTIFASEQPDIDHVCKLPIDGVETFLYVRADPVRCRAFGGCEYTVSGAFITQASGPTNAPLEGVGYDYGGNHHNDFITLPSAEGTLKIYHSSFGFGFRACQPPDCVQVLDGADVVEDGCTSERTRPATCVKIAPDGSEPPLPDSFAPCPGDPNAR